MEIFATVVKNEVIAQNIHEITLHAPECFKNKVAPGQFVHIKVPARGDLLLRRPISIMLADSEKQTITLGIQTMGDGTKAICETKAGEKLDVLGPVGHGFDTTAAQNAWVVGGGIGVAPMLYLLKEIAEQKPHAIFGFRSENFAFGTEYAKSFGAEVSLCSDDGTLGQKGYVTDVMQALVAAQKPSVIYACGPTPMLRSVQAFAKQHGITCYLSLEERMGCGIGACVTCTCKAVVNGEEKRPRVCMDGPVFNAAEVII